MIGYKKRKLLLGLLAALLLLLLVRLPNQTLRIGPLRALFDGHCSASVSPGAELARVGSTCALRPRDNVFSVSRGLLHRNARASPADRCHLWPSGVEVTARATLVRGNLLTLRCRIDEKETALVMPIVPRDTTQPGGASGGAWNVLVLGLGGLTWSTWRQQLPQSFELLSKEFRGAIVSRLVPLNNDPNHNLKALLRHNGEGRWITQAFAERNFLTQGSVFASACSTPNLQVPAALNLSSFMAARSKLRSSRGCVGVAPEGSVMLSWLRDGHLLHGSRRFLAFLHLADLVFPSLARLDADLVAFLLDFLNNSSFARTFLLLYSLPDKRSGLEPGLLLLNPPADSRASGPFRWDILRSATASGDFFTPNDVNRILAFLASDDRPHHLADIGYDARTCARLGISSAVCSCIKT